MSASNGLYRYREVIDLIEDQVGADIPRDVIKVAVEELDDPAATEGLQVDLREIGDVDQTGVDFMAVVESSSPADELRTRLFGVDDGGNLAELQVEELGTNLGGTETAAVTKLSEVLETVANTEARVSLYAEDDAGNLNEVQAEEINTSLGGAETGVVTATARALAEVGGTEVRMRHLGLDDGGTLQEVQAEALNTGVAAGTIGEVTYLARALNSQDLDEFISRVTDSTGTQIDPLTQDPLQTVANDELRSRVFGPDAGGTLQQVNAEAFDTALAATDIGIATYVARALNDIGSDELVSRITDSAGTQINPATNDDQPNYFDDDINSVDLSGGDFTIAETDVRGTGDIIIKVESSDNETFTVTLEWTDGAGNVLYTQEPAEATDVTDSNLKFNVASDHFQLTITDTSSAAQNIINGTVNVH